MGKSSEKWGKLEKVVKSSEKLEKVAKSGEKLEQVGKAGESWGQVGKSGEKVVKSGEFVTKLWPEQALACDGGDGGATKNIISPKFSNFWDIIIFIAIV